MSDPSESQGAAPPVAVKRDIEMLVRREATVIGGEQFAVRMSQSPTESLPVLETFRDFLELERRRARNRLVGLAMLFSFLFIVALLGGGYVIHGVLNRVGDAEASVTEVRVQLADERADARVATVELRADNAALKRKLDDDSAAIATSLAEARASVDTFVKQQGLDLETLNGQLAGVKTDNTELLSRYDAMLTSFTAATNQLASELARVDAAAAERIAAIPVRAPEAEPPPVRLDRPSPSPTAPEAGSSAASLPLAPPLADEPLVATATSPSIPLTITPQGTQQAIPWRVPVP